MIPIQYRMVKNGYKISLLICTVILMFILLFDAVAFAEINYSFKYGKFKSDQFSFDIPNDISVIHQETDSALVLKTEKEDIFLGIILEDKTDITLDYLDKNLNATDKSFVASTWTTNDPNAIISTLKQTARIIRSDIEMLEYRFDAMLNGKPWIAFHTFVHIKDSNHFCEIKLIADSRKAKIASLYYLILTDSIMANPSAILSDEEWLCDNCGAINSDNFCSKCGTKKPSSSSNSDTTASPTKEPSISNINTSVLRDKVNATYDSIVSIAKNLAELIVYNAEFPTNGDTVSITVEGKSILVHADFKYAMDVFYEFYKEYFNSIKNNDISKIGSLAMKTVEVDAALEKLDDLELSDGDMLYYMSVYAKILKIIGDLRSN